MKSAHPTAATKVKLIDQRKDWLTVKRILFLFLLLSLTLPATIALAAEDQVAGVLTNTLEVRYEGDTFEMYDVDGFRVYPIIKDGSTYLPVRALSEKFNKTIEWDGENFAVKLSDDPPTLNPQQPLPGREINYPITVTAVESRKLTIYYNGEIVTFQDVNGTRVYPLLYNGTTYLPIRALSDLWDTAIVWDADRYAVYIGETTGDSSTIEAMEGNEVHREQDVTFFGVTWPTALTATKGAPLALEVPEGVTDCHIRGIDKEGKARVSVIRPEGDEIVLKQSNAGVSEFTLDIPLSGATQLIVDALSADGVVYLVEVTWS